MKELCERGKYVLFSDRFLRRSRPSTHARSACRSKKRLTNQEFMPSDYYTSYIPFITATPKEDFIPVGNTNKQQVGGRKLLLTSRIVLYIAETIKNRTIPFVLVWFCFMLFNLSDAWAQSAESRTAEGQTAIKPLQIGDTIPEELWKAWLSVLSIKDENVQYSSLELYKDKVLILDFWNIWCGSCLTAMDHAGQLMEELGNEIAILPVTYQSREDILKFSAKNEIVKNTKLPLVVEDDVLSAYFPHRSVPHVVMVRDGKVFHIGGLESMKQDGLEAAIQNKQAYFKYFKNDFSEKESLLKRIDRERAIGYRFMSGYRNDALPVQGTEIDSAEAVKRIYFYNHSLLELYRFALDIPVTFPLNRISLQQANLEIEEFAFHHDMGDKLEWLQKHAISYEICVPIDLDDAVIKQMLIQDLQLFTGLSANVTERSVLVFEIGKNLDLRAHQQESANNMAVFYVLDAYNSKPDAVPFIYEESLARQVFVPYRDLSGLSAPELLDLLRDQGIPFDSTTEILTILTVNKG
ncbi:TlpA family protein disulfide reductase [Sphingobacterium haloxyli]|uniref:Thioredoxin domain-containing protein n=1 Tax=Sphingobacterium haloxyli TaxID=2100533 RepID=A0A2S9J4A4_9SPHI|nr:redoxin domain-containing protein [Sphingobacterium haloxyli]PRD47628.1 hypothetical protein C5745_09990 [Sphingobacterium haloxyli]